jgi:transketolase
LGRSFREAFGRALVEVGDVFRNLIVIDVDVARSTKTIYFAERFPNRFIQLGISEQDAVGTAAGLAISGKIPLLAGFSMFILRGWEQIRNTVVRDGLNVKIVGTHSGLSDYLDGSSHQCLEDIALMRVLPNMMVVSPSDTVSTRSLLYQILEHHGPVYFRLGRDNATEIYGDEGDIRLGKINVLVDGSDLTIVSHGSMTQICMEVADILREKGISPRVLDSHTIKPLDVGRILDAAVEAPPIFVVEDHSVYGGLGSAISEFLSERRPTKIFLFGIRDRFGSGSKSYLELLKFLGFMPEDIADRIKVVLDGV